MGQFADTLLTLFVNVFQIVLLFMGMLGILTLRSLDFANKDEGIRARKNLVLVFLTLAGLQLYLAVRQLHTIHDKYALKAAIQKTQSPEIDGLVCRKIYADCYCDACLDY